MSEGVADIPIPIVLLIHFFSQEVTGQPGDNPSAGGENSTYCAVPGTGVKLEWDVNALTCLQHNLHFKKCEDY